VMSMFVSLNVCLSVCLSTRISQKAHVKTLLNFTIFQCIVTLIVLRYRNTLTYLLTYKVSVLVSYRHGSVLL